MTMADMLSSTTETVRPSGSDVAVPVKLDAAMFWVAGVCALASLMATLDTTVVAVAQRALIAQFGSSHAVVAWTMTGYMLALATTVPIAGWAADRFGTKRLFMASASMFTLASVLCAMAPTMLLLNIFRVLQGIGGGMLLPLGFMILTRAAGPRRMGRLMAARGVPMLIGPIAGPILGGWLVGAYGWKWIFLINLPAGLAVVILAAIVLPQDHPAPAQAFDLTGALLLSPGVAAFLFGVSIIPEHGTVADHHVLLPAITGLALIAAFVWHAWHRTNHPLIDLRLFKNRMVALGNVTVTVFAVASFGTGLILPSYFQLVLHQTPMQSGMHMAPQGLGALLTMPFAGAFMDKRGPVKIVLLGISLIATGLGVFAIGVARQADYLPTLAIGLAVMGMGMGCAMMPLSAAIAQALAPHQIARGSTLISVNQQVSGAIGTALMSVVLTGQFDRSENIAAANKLAVRAQTARSVGAPVDPSTIPRGTLHHDLAARVVQDLAHAYTAVFVLALVLVVSAIVPVALLPRRPRAARNCARTTKPELVSA
jgi:EmrB/QacA subfamily drug resistance transporter